jgi:hypothetical protein
MGLRKALRSLDKVHRGHRQIATSLATGDLRGVKDGVKKAHSGHTDHLRNAVGTLRQDTASLVRRHPELGFAPGIREISEGRLPAPSPGLAFLQNLLGAQSGARSGAAQA